MQWIYYSNEYVTTMNCWLWIGGGELFPRAVLDECTRHIVESKGQGKGKGVMGTCHTPGFFVLIIYFC